MQEKKWGIFALITAATGLVLGLALADLFVWTPDFSKLKDSVDLPIRLANGDKATKAVGPRTLGWTPLSGMSEWLPRAVVASEDGTFYSHKGVDVYELKEAFKKDWKEGRFARGGSTITQQVLKNVYLSHYPKLWRKVKEMIWASKLEEALSKSQILAFYLNMVEWGPGVYGIGESSRHYFSKSPASLTTRESAFLAMLLPSPRRYHAAFFPRRQLTQWASNRVNRILEVMNKTGQLQEELFTTALNEKLWGATILPDLTPGAPKDLGWEVSESSEEFFEPPGTATALARPVAAPIAIVPVPPPQAVEVPAPDLADVAPTDPTPDTPSPD